jgi:hypothetical protein
MQSAMTTQTNTKELADYRPYSLVRYKKGNNIKEVTIRGFAAAYLGRK